MKVAKKVQWFPPCFNGQQQYRSWRAAGERSGDKPALKRSRYCIDCTPEYQQQMKQAGRCLHPDTKFQADAQGFVQGVRQLKVRKCS